MAAIEPARVSTVKMPFKKYEYDFPLQVHVH